MTSFLYLALLTFTLTLAKSDDEGPLFFNLAGQDTWYGILSVPEGGITLKITMVSGEQAILYVSKDNNYPEGPNIDSQFDFTDGSVQYLYIPGPARDIVLEVVSLADVDLNATVETYDGVYRACDYAICPYGQICNELPDYEYQCVPGVTTTTTATTTTTKTTTTTTKTAPNSNQKYNCANKSPCTPENASQNKFYFPAEDPKKFVQCSQWGQCYVMPCSPGLVWDQSILNCNWP